MLLCFPWHGFAFGLWAHAHTHTLFADRYWQPEVSGDTLAQTGPQTCAARVDIDFLFGITKRRAPQLRDRGILWTTGHTNKQSSPLL